MLQRKPHRSRQSGFTLIEIIISMVLLGILGVIGTKMFTGSFYTTGVISTQHLAYSEARYALERMSREIREIKYDMSNDSLSITTMSNSVMTFDKEPLSGTTGVPVSLKYTPGTPSSAGTLGISYSPSSPSSYSLLARNIEEFSFEYLQTDGNPAKTANDIRLVRITLRVKPQNAQALSLLTLVNLRNI